MSKAWQAWCRFWFEFHSPLGLALVRIQLGLVLSYLYFSRQIFSLEKFAADGMVERGRALSLIPQPIRPPFGWFELWPDSMNTSVHILFVGLCVMVLLGVSTRWFGLAAWVLHMGFIQRNYSILFGADVISCAFLLYLAFTRCDERLSVKAWLGRASSAPAGDVSSLFARLLQVQLGVIYAYTGFEKLKGVTWRDGTALWTVLGNAQMVTMDFSWLRHLSLLLVVLTFVTILFEVYWPLAVISPVLRRPWLAMGVAFHCGIGFMMGLWPFSLIMLSPYWLFLTPEELRRWVEPWIARLRYKS